MDWTSVPWTKDERSDAHRVARSGDAAAFELALRMSRARRLVAEVRGSLENRIDPAADSWLTFRDCINQLREAERLLGGGE